MEQIVIGTIIKPQGLKGEIKVLPLTDDAQRFLDLNEVSIEGRQTEVLSASVRDGFVYLILNGVDDREKAESLRDKQVSIDRDRAVILPEGRYFIFDMVGCEIYADNKRLGVLKEILQYGSADIYCVEATEKPFMFPALKRVLLNVNVIDKRIDLDAAALAEVAVYED